MRNIPIISLNSYMKMSHNKLKYILKQKGGYAVGILVLFSMLFLILEVYNGRFWQSDFTVCYKSAARLLQGDNLFQIAEDGHYVFKYSPVSALLFIPFTIIKLSISRYFYWVFLTGIIIANFIISAILSYKINGVNNLKLNKVIILGAIVLVVHFQRELHLGQVNQILLLFYLLMIQFILKDKPWVVGALLALSIFIKPFGLIFIPYFVVKGKFKELLYTVVFFGVIFFLPLLFYGWEMFIEQNALWYNELIVELSHKQDLMLPANHTIFSVLARYTFIGILLVTPLSVQIFQFVILALIGILILWFIYLGKQKSFGEISEIALLISLIPLLSFTSQNAFGFAGLLVMIILVYFNKLSLIEKIIAVIGFVLIGGNYYDIWGSALSGFFNDISLVSIGTIILMVLLFKKRLEKVV